MPPKRPPRGRPSAAKTASEDFSSPTDTDGASGSEDELAVHVDVDGILKPIESVEQREDDASSEVAQQIINDLSAEADADRIDVLSEDVENIHRVDTSRQNTNHPDSISWLRKCQEIQDHMFPDQQDQKKKMGIWELDLLHQGHECYNAYLFTSLTPSSAHEQSYPNLVYGYGTISLHVICDKDTDQWTELAFDNVRYVRPMFDNNPYNANHRIGRGALPRSTHLHLPHGPQGSKTADGFLSIADGVGCALGRLDQGGRRTWALRTFDGSVPTVVPSTTLSLRRPSGFGWFSFGQGSGNATGRNRHGKRDRGVDDDEVGCSLVPQTTLLTCSCTEPNQQKKEDFTSAVHVRDCGTMLVHVTIDSSGIWASRLRSQAWVVAKKRTRYRYYIDSSKEEILVIEMLKLDVVMEQ